MRYGLPFQRLLVGLAVLGLLFPQAAIAAERTGRLQPPAVVDIQLHLGNVLWGQVTDAQGVARSDMPVRLYRGDRSFAVTRTNEQGYFAFRGLPRGVYRVATLEAEGVYRVWDAASAPPAAREGGIQLVTGGPIVRGAAPRILERPWLLAAVVATAIAVPIAVANANDDDAPPSS